MSRISTSFLVGITAFSLVFPSQIFGQIIDASPEVIQAPIQKSAFSIDVPSLDNSNTTDTISTDSDISGNVANVSSRTAAMPSVEERSSGGSSNSGDSRGTTKSASDIPYSTVQPINTIRQIKPQANLSSGAYVYRYPIQLPPGRNDFTPDLAIVYNSQDRSDGTYIGYGWNLDVPYIIRENKYGNERMYDTPYESFLSSLDGSLAYISNDQFIAKTDTGAFNKYTYTTSSTEDDHWKVETKDGVMYFFGSASTTRIASPYATSTGYKWMLDRIKDANGNEILYTYTANQGQIYPSKIEYAYTDAPATTTPIFSISFGWVGRQDDQKSYFAGFKVETRNRLNNIDIRENGVLVRRYVVTYDDNSLTGRSRVSSIRDQGDPFGTLIELTTNFQYTSSNFSFASSTADITIRSLDYTNGVIVTDVDGDGYADVLQSTRIENPSTIDKEYVWINQHDNTFATSTSWQIPHKQGGVVLIRICTRLDAGSFCNADGTIVADINGDAESDYVYGPVSPPFTSEVHINSGTNWQYDSSWTGAVPKLDPDSLDRPMVGDINGDGLFDRLRTIGPLPFEIDRNNGIDFSFFTMPSEVPDQLGIRAVDMNHDGLTDIFRALKTFGGSYDAKIYINQGATSSVVTSSTGFTYDSGFTNLRSGDSNMFEDFTTGPTGTFIADMNGDDLPDMFSSIGKIFLHRWDHYLNAGDLQVGISSDTIVRQVGDINGDGLLDIIHSVCNPDCVADIFFNTGNTPDLLSKITLPTGGVITTSYEASSQYKDAGGNLLNPELPFTTQTIQAVGETDSVTGTVSTTTYSYAGGHYFFKDSFDRRFAGFETVTKIKPDGTEEITYFHQGDTASTTLYEDLDHHAKIGKAYRIDRLDSNGNLMTRTTTKWNAATTSIDTAFLVYPSQIITETYDGNGTHRDVAKTFSFATTTGNLTQEKEWGEVTASDPLTFSDIGDDVRTTDYDYAESSTDYIKLLSQQTVKDYANTTVADQKITYDDLSFGEVSVGNPTKKEFLIEGTTYASTTHVYNSFGLMLSDRDPNYNETTYVYDSLNLYPETTTNALGHETERLYDYSSGQPTQTITPNGEIYETVYDSLDRIKTQKSPDPLTGALVTIKTITYTDTANQYAVQETNNLLPALSTDIKTYFDGFGRAIQTRSRAEDNGGTIYAVQDTVYDEQGRVEKESLPYFSSGVNKTSATTTASLYASYTYDALDRVVNVDQVFGDTATTYDNWYATTTDSNNNKKVFSRDAFGRLNRVDEYATTSPYVTRYEYDTLGNLIKIIDAEGNVRNFEYDMLGRRTFAEDMHELSDIYFGTTTYAYDFAGNLTEKKKPDFSTVTYAYDTLNRITSENASLTSGLEAEYTYDACSQGVGRLCIATTTTITAGKMVLNNRYDYAGNIGKETKIIDGNVYLTDYTYDYLGNPLTIKNPNDALITYEYNNAGHPEAVYWKESGVATTTIVSDFDYAPTGDVTFQTNANGTTIENAYDENELYRLKRKIIDDGSNTLQQFLYTYDAVGNITKIAVFSDTATLPNRVTDYEYDSLYRLASSTVNASSTNIFSEIFTYTPVGNILTSPEGVYWYQGTTTANFANPHAATRVGAETLTYDKNGNLVNRTGNLTHTWDWNNRLVKIKLPSQQTGGFSSQSFGGPGQQTKYATYGYDTSGQRVYSHVTNLATTTYPSIYFNEEGSATTTEHIFVNGIPVATVVIGTGDPTILWNSSDHLRSTSLVTDDSANITEEVGYTAFGSLKNDVGTTIEKRKYTGHEYDADALDYTYAKARYLNTNWGRFLSEDPSYLAIGDINFEDRYGQSLESVLSDPQSLNSYSYVKNNPINLIDPDGEIAIPFALPVFFVAPQAFLIGVAVVGVGALVVGTAALLRNNDGLSQRPFEQSRLVRGPEQAKIFNNEPPKFDPKWPLWKIIGAVCSVACPAIAQQIEDYKKFNEGIQNFKEGTQTPQGNAQNNTNQQNIMMNGDYTTKLYTTPSGAVIDWWGNIISGPKN